MKGGVYRMLTLYKENDIIRILEQNRMEAFNTD